MNTWQAARQIKYLLQQSLWEDAATSVFAASSVIVTQGTEIDALSQRRLPLAMIRIGSSPSDPDFGGDFPEIQQQEFDVTIVTHVAGGQHGEGGIVGASRGGVSDSAGRGVLEIEEKVLQTLLRLDDDDGLRLNLYATGETEVRSGTELGDIAIRDIRLQGTVTVERSYRAARSFTASDAGSGNASGTVGYPSTRFDTSNLVLRRAAGATAPASASDGDAVAVVGDLPTSWTDDPGAGQFSYSAFVAYDEFGDGTNLRYSPASSSTVTVT